MVSKVICLLYINEVETRSERITFRDPFLIYREKKVVMVVIRKKLAINDKARYNCMQLYCEVSNITISELMLNIKDVHMEQLVFQNEIKTAEQVKELNGKGYRVSFTEEEFEDRFKVPTDCVAYTPSISYSCMYFNRDSLAVLQFPLDFYIADGEKSPLWSNIETFYRAVRSIEAEVASGDYATSISGLPDSMKIEYFNLLVERGMDFEEVYRKFIDFYTYADYGFGCISEENIEKIFQKKTSEDIQATNEALTSLPDTITIYRGQTQMGTPLKRAYSWSLDKSVAMFFAARLGTDNAEIVEARVKKEKVIEYIKGYEQEILVRYRDVEIINTTKLYGLDRLEELLPRVTKTYLEYKKKLYKLDYNLKDTVHGYEHSLRVLLLSLLLSEELGLSNRNRDRLATAAIYHDCRRKHDGESKQHGYDSAEYYKSSVTHPDETTAFLIQYHSIEDKYGYKEIEENPILSEKADTVKLLFNIFKDCDGLDRVRFGLRALDLSYLRLDISQHYPLIARICHEEVHS